MNDIPAGYTITNAWECFGKCYLSGTCLSYEQLRHLGASSIPKKGDVTIVKDVRQVEYNLYILCTE